MRVRLVEVAEIVHGHYGSGMDQRDHVGWNKEEIRPVAHHFCREANVGPEPRKWDLPDLAKGREAFDTGRVGFVDI
jgi:hypothetical protein